MARRRRVRESAVDPAAEAQFVETLSREPIFVAAQAVLALKLVLIVFVFDPNIIDAFALPKSAIAHVATAVLAVLLVGLVVKHGRRVVVWSPAHVAIGALLVVFAVAAAFALDQETAFFGIWRRYLGLGQMLDNALLYVAAVTLLPTPRDLARLGIVALSTAAVVAGYMFVQKAGLDPVKYLQGPNIAPPGTFGQPDVSGSYAAIASVTSIAAALWIGRGRAQVALLALGVACALASVMTNVRGGLIALAFGWIAMLVVFVERRIIVRALLGAGAATAIGALLTPAGQRFLSLADLIGDQSAQIRLEAWSTAIRLIGARPILGLGPDNYGIAYPAAREERSALLSGGELQNSTHNWLLHITTSAGIAGLVALSALLLIVTRMALRLRRDRNAACLALVPLAAYFGQGLVAINDMGTDWIPWLCCGVIAGASGQRLVAGPSWLSRVRFVPVAVGVVALVAGVASFVASSQRFAASDHFGRSDALVAESRGGEALPEAISAVRLDPRRAEYWNGLGAALNATNDSVGASAAFAEAGRLKPSSAVFWSNLALMRLAVGDSHGASLALRRATDADPYDLQSRDLSARIALLLNDYEKASRDGHLAVTLQPTEAPVYEAPTLADIQLGKLQDAEAMLRSGLAAVRPEGRIQVHLLLAQVLHAEKRDADARAEIAAALAIDPKNDAALKLQQDYK